MLKVEEKYTLKVSSREKEKAKRLRKRGILPAVLYSHGESWPIQIEERDFRNLILKMGEISESIIIELDWEGKTTPAIIKDVQRHPVSGKVLHVDFYKVTYGETVETYIRLKYVGKPIGVEKGGILEYLMHEVLVEIDPRNLVREIEVDISSLDLGDSLHARDIPLPEGAILREDPDAVAVLVDYPASMEEKAPEEEGEEEEKTSQEES